MGTPPHNVLAQDTTSPAICCPVFISRWDLSFAVLCTKRILKCSLEKHYLIAFVVHLSGKQLSEMISENTEYSLPTPCKIFIIPASKPYSLPSIQCIINAVIVLSYLLFSVVMYSSLSQKLLSKEPSCREP